MGNFFDFFLKRAPLAIAVACTLLVVVFYALLQIISLGFGRRIEEAISTWIIMVSGDAMSAPIAVIAYWSVWAILAAFLLYAGLAFLLATLRRIFLYEKKWEVRPAIEKSLTQIRTWAIQTGADVKSDRFIGDNSRNFGHVPPEIHQAFGVIEEKIHRYHPTLYPLVVGMNALMVRFNILSDHHRLRQEGVPQQDFIVSVDAETANIINQCDRIRNCLSL